MMNLYGVLKLLHVLSVVMWIGGVAALWTITLRLARAGDDAGVAKLLPVGMRYGQRVVGPASGIVLITGVWMAIITQVYRQPFVAVGMIGILLHFILGATVVRRSWMSLGQLVSASTRDESAIAAATTRVTTWSWIYLLIMITVIAFMVLKP